MLLLLFLWRCVGIHRYIPRVLGPAFVDKLELMVWSDDKRWVDRTGTPWSNYCLFKSGGGSNGDGNMSYSERRVMEKVRCWLCHI